jgi:1-acyl-sn-glycerol-3-phosphate acyltransferase
VTPRPTSADGGARRDREPSAWRVPGRLRPQLEEIEERLARLPTRLNEYGFDPFGFDPDFNRSLLLVLQWVYRSWFRVSARGLENVPAGRVLLIGNHAGNTFAWDGAMLAMALFYEGEPPRIVRGMAEYFLPTIPFFNVYMQRFGSVVGTPENCTQLLEQDEAIMAFPEGQRGFVKTYAHRYELQEFGLGFMRLALETDTPIVPVGIVGGEEQSPGIANLRSIGKLIGAPAFPITLTFPWLGLAGFLPLPVKYRIEFGEPLTFEGDPTEDDETIGEKVAVVKGAIERLVAAGLERRQGWFR